MDEFRYYHTKWSKSDRERKISYEITNMRDMEYNLKYFKRTYSQNRNRLKDFETKLMVTKGWGEINQEVGINIYTTLYKIDE